MLSMRMCFMILFLFFSSRRRHTRFDCDWSSDVCSSDLSLKNEALFCEGVARGDAFDPRDRKSTRLNSSHSQISYAVFCLKKKKNETSSPVQPSERESSLPDDARTCRY